MEQHVGDDVKGWEKPLYNSRIVDTYIRFLKSRYKQVDIAEILDYAGMSPYEVADQWHWFTQSQVDRFYEKVVELTDNENIAREAGRFAASPDTLGVVKQFLLASLSPSRAFELVGRTSAKMTRSADYEGKILKSNQVEIIVTPRPGAVEQPYQCQNRMGFFDALVAMFSHQLPTIEHPECIFHGDSACRYIISWKITPATVWKGWRNNFLILSSLVSLVLSLLTITGQLHLSWLLGFILVAVLILGVLTDISRRYEVKSLQENLTNIKDTADQLMDRIASNIDDALMAIHLGETISRHTSVDEILQSVVLILEDRMNYDRGLILLKNEDEEILNVAAHFGYAKEQQQKMLRRMYIRMDNPHSKGVFVQCFREKKPFLVTDVEAIKADLSVRGQAYMDKLADGPFICCPILCEGQVTGLLAVDNRLSKRPLAQKDIRLLMGLTPMIGVSMRNAQLIDNQYQKFNSIIEVLAASTDARDPLTAGHSLQVTEYALGICEELGLSGEYRDMIRVAALLHDYGKIGVSDAVLKKVGRLNSDEMREIQTHSQKTFDILEKVNFDGIYRLVPEVAGAHHEKIDGSGYPQGLKGEEIPLGARIIAVADFFEAITARRHYREAMDQRVAFKLLQEETTSHFDPRVVHAFAAYLQKNDSKLDVPQVLLQTFSRRKHPRFPYKEEVQFNFRGGSGTGRTLNLGAEGLYVETHLALPKQESVSLTVKLPEDSPEPVTIPGKVVWVNSSNQPHNPFFAPGFGFRIDKKVYSSLPESFLNFLKEGPA